MANDSLAACIAEIKANPGRFYVYILRRPDGAPFYVGCGGVRAFGKKNQRIAFHEKDAQSGKRSHKCNLIRLIWNGGGEVQYEIVKWCESEQEMFAHEIALIAEIGRADKKRGPLTNWSDGGDGLVNRSAEVSAKASRTMLSLIDDEWRRASSERIKAHWKSPEGRAKRLLVNQSAETKARQSVAATEVNRKTRGQKSATMVERWRNDPDYGARQAAAHTAAMSRPEYKQKMGDKSKSRWSDPAFKERMIAIHKARWAKKRIATA